MPFRPLASAFGPADFAGERALPDGWSWYHYPHYYGPGDCDTGQVNMVVNTRTTYDTALERVRAMRDWGLRVGIWIEFSGARAFQNKILPVYVRMNPQLPHNPNILEALCTRPCPSCSNPIDPFEATCNRCNVPLECASCHNSLLGYNQMQNGEGLGWAPNGVAEGMPWLGCGNCFARCRHRTTQERVRPGSRIRPAEYCSRMCRAGQQLCEEHSNPFTCADCQRTNERSLQVVLEVEGTTYCETCATRRCARCGVQRTAEQRWRSIDDHRVCGDCYRIANGTRMEVIDRDVRMTADDLLIPALPDRPVRLVSIEQEFDVGDGGDPHAGQRLATELYTAGLSCYNERMRYHAGDHTFPAHIERDRTVEQGGELIYNRLALDTPEDAQNMARICELVQNATESQRIGFTAKCGTHIHIDLHGYTIPDARNYVTLYSFLEDVIFRLGSAGYGDHRSVVSKSGYAVPIRKDKWGNLVEFGVEFLRNANHTDSLNMQHFYNSFQSCTCGAIEFGDIAECRCIRTKCTAEWRVFNGTGNPRKLHAWTAFVQALTSWCQDRELDLDLYEPLGFEREIDFTKDLGDAHRNLIEAWRPRLEWIWENLPLTEQEKLSIVYCIVNSPLKHVGDDFMEHLGSIERIEEPERELELTVIAGRNTPATPPRINLRQYEEPLPEPDEYYPEDDSDF